MPDFALLATHTHTLPDTDWDAFVAAHPDTHLLQTTRWADLKRSAGWQAERIALAEGKRLVAGGQILYRRLPWGQTLAYVPKGPLVDWRRADLVRPLLAGMVQVSATRRAALLKLEPDLPDSAQLELILSSYGLRRGHTVQPRSTIYLPLDDGPDAALARMKQKWRYNVRLAERKEVTVRTMTAADLPAWHAMNEETGRRDGFGVHDSAYYDTAFHLFPADQARWLLAEWQGQPLAAIAVFALGHKSWYMWGASSNSERQRMPNHALQWAGLNWAAERGATLYDLWGIPDEVGANPAAYSEDYVEQQGGLWGVYRFKQGFGGQVMRYTGAWDLPVSSIGSRLYAWARRWRGL
ncbi:MAG: peptidoglycan bridge formation glycyltransferase FemA/FemB family protein [Caldilineales bacterium]